MTDDPQFVRDGLKVNGPDDWPNGETCDCGHHLDEHYHPDGGMEPCVKCEECDTFEVDGRGRFDNYYAITVGTSGHEPPRLPPGIGDLLKAYIKLEQRLLELEKQVWWLRRQPTAPTFVCEHCGDTGIVHETADGAYAGHIPVRWHLCEHCIARKQKETQ